MAGGKCETGVAGGANRANGRLSAWRSPDILVDLREASMARHSAGILLYRGAKDGVEVLLVHPGGPFWRGRDRGAWQIPKGLVRAGEEPLAAACRETEEELGIRIDGIPVPLATIRQKGGKVVEAFALHQDVDVKALHSNSFEIEWPPGSGTMAAFPEIDAARWMSLGEAGHCILASQDPLLGALAELLEPGPR
ncbi:NUDIX domain-containing protein [Novosphingobium sp. G106]|uniref:NUDIX domain-containing protein n=1 Tax=Novosphingobium sp. G106 TaxID=2849500 RepID=UPI001C2D5180|nr:NUDIX domain-containing protein [Novosphingobium sp. G106]MBV1691926.1 NUDIX domain-containing protein [Novosphingobium sp. G106]